MTEQTTNEQLAELAILWNKGDQIRVLNALEDLCAARTDASLIATAIHYNILARRYPRADYFSRLGKEMYPDHADFKNKITYLMADPFTPATFARDYSSIRVAA